ncbi:eukaryotic mitochondrial regulator protein-domain-containing protein [Venturia nashicola]|uniref:Eukaryotic mitochondrial regulator protein-domain-containing protein n=1 Tax=Venturia nashicola TaxID=86259 RepID=A0A4Z1P7J2_9PEZI|nr:eukaryotic mitochondrial regulator protein-domain-containing protein [Venturia nashicola]TLD32152.1 eukaryotic mitochondrial regulator protein-domain-containing protein [Venturia nashicola]
MLSWLNQAGKEFKVPREDRTPMYLGGLGALVKFEEGKAYNAAAAAKGQEGQVDPQKEVVEEDNDRTVEDEDFDPSQEERRDAERRTDERGERGEFGRSGEQRRILGNRELSPFPLNRAFLSQPVLSEQFRETIYLKAVNDKMSVRTISAESGVTMERVAAVIRMKQMERDWVQQQKPLAAVYSRIVLGMLPRTEEWPKQQFDRRTNKPKPIKWHEPVNDLPVHPATTQQIFHPVAESRAFTRADAGRAFHPDLLSADERVPHPEMIQIERLARTHPSTPETLEFKRQLAAAEKEAADKYLERKKKREEKVQVYHGQKYDFRFQDVSVDSVGKDGRSRAGVGWRYGMPHEDRKPGQVKIPTSV